MHSSLSISDQLVICSLLSSPAAAETSVPIATTKTSSGHRMALLLQSLSRRGNGMGRTLEPVL
eukprot:CAMPEP_0169166310 /NCGR_PEP_ID=MMETSP1015-20121227/59871_1 /TAXON_ID=342587 /ORGANISM="Karlodinium micrum, Strain CCMP2283" /LENGTH=62 /DNA_ID=CAMNT_0009238947 /DNA_START=495 /DNA_END=679 /DNA_ORIENTATION=-